MTTRHLGSVAVNRGSRWDVRLTARGQDLWRAATQRRTAEERDLVTEVLSGEDLATLNVLLARLLARLECRFGPATRHDVRREV